MANPKRRHSKSRRDKRRAHWKLEQPDLSVCPQCKEPKLPHCVCLNCGYYNGKQIVKVKQEKKETKEKKEKKEKKD